MSKIKLTDVIRAASARFDSLPIYRASIEARKELMSEKPTRKVSVHKITLLVVDFDELGNKGVTDVIETTRYPNRSVHPRVVAVETRTVDWNDDHPLNKHSAQDAAFEELFR